MSGSAATSSFTIRSHFRLSFPHQSCSSGPDSTPCFLDQFSIDEQVSHPFLMRNMNLASGKMDCTNGTLKTSSGYLSTSLGEAVAARYAPKILCPAFLKSCVATAASSL